MRKLFNPVDGQLRPTIEDESADITVFVRVLEDPTGVLWHNFVKYVSFLCSSCSSANMDAQLRLQEGDGLCRPEEPGRNMLHELPPSVIILYQLLPKGALRVGLASWRLLIATRLCTKFPQRKITRPKASPWHYKDCSTTCRRPISQSVGSSSS